MILTVEGRAYALRKQLHYQRLVDARGKPSSSMEALLRLRDCDGLVHPPEDYLRRLRDDRFRMRRLTTWAIFQALGDLRRARETGASVSNVSVNVATEDLTSDYLIAVVASALETHRLPPHSLTVEISESTVAHDLTRMAKAAEELRRLGVGVAIDDFGTCCSVLRYLSDIPATVVKFDRCFLERAPQCALTRKVLSGAVSLVRSIGMKAVVEGVETGVQREIAVDAGADEMQGYLFGRPAALDAC